MVRSQYLVHVRIQYVSSLVFAEETFDNDMKEIKLMMNPIVGKMYT